MPRINKPSAPHTGPAAIGGWQWLPFSDATYLARVEQAVQLIDSRIKGQSPCEAAFAALPGGLKFTDVWNDTAVWISYDPGSTANRYGATLHKEVTLSQYTCRMGRWTIVATLVHELAHVNGATGMTTDAEDTLLKCLLQQHHNPAILGQLRSAPRNSLFTRLNQGVGSTRAGG